MLLDEDTFETWQVHHGQAHHAYQPLTIYAGYYNPAIGGLLGERAAKLHDGAILTWPFTEKVTFIVPLPVGRLGLGLTVGRAWACMLTGRSAPLRPGTRDRYRGRFQPAQGGRRHSTHGGCRSRRGGHLQF